MIRGLYSGAGPLMMDADIRSRRPVRLAACLEVGQGFQGQVFSPLVLIDAVVSRVSWRGRLIWPYHVPSGRRCHS